jgi:hypothetical protein
MVMIYPIEAESSRLSVGGEVPTCQPFLSVFTPSVEGTRTYLTRVVLRDPPGYSFLSATLHFIRLG